MMLQKTLSYFRSQDGKALTRESLADHLNTSTEVVEQLILTLIRKGKLIPATSTACSSCAGCKDPQICFTVDKDSRNMSYFLADRHV
jgi:hypothetical protein